MTSFVQTVANTQCVPNNPYQVERNDFRRARLQGQIERLTAILTGRSNHLLDIKTLSKGKSFCNSRHVGTQTIRIDQIKGSEGRCHDFDHKFNPLKSHNHDRWISIASAWRRDVYLPAIELIKIQGVYVVRDGHHRVSVAKYMGCEFVDAHVTEWVLA